MKSVKNVYKVIFVYRAAIIQSLLLKQVSKLPKTSALLMPLKSESGEKLIFCNWNYYGNSIFTNIECYCQNNVNRINKYGRASEAFMFTRKRITNTLNFLNLSNIFLFVYSFWSFLWFSKRSLDPVQSPKYGAQSEDQIYFLVVVEVARQAC